MQTSTPGPSIFNDVGPTSANVHAKSASVEDDDSENDDPIAIYSSAHDAHETNPFDGTLSEESVPRTG